jgi:hypothetical protein
MNDAFGVSEGYPNLHPACLEEIRAAPLALGGFNPAVTAGGIPRYPGWTNEQHTARRAMSTGIQLITFAALAVVTAAATAADFHVAPNNGFFVDEGSKGFLFESKVVHRTSGESVRFN